jgi:formamidopyrimidine-DNA glycosylase
MPELPEVETVKRELKPLLEGKRLDSPVIYWKKAVHSPLEEYVSALKGKTVTSVERRGKYILIYLDDAHKILFHLMRLLLLLLEKLNYILYLLYHHH